MSEVNTLETGLKELQARAHSEKQKRVDAERKVKQIEKEQASYSSNVSICCPQNIVKFLVL